MANLFKAAPNVVQLGALCSKAIRPCECMDVCVSTCVYAVDTPWSQLHSCSTTSFHPVSRVQHAWHAEIAWPCGRAVNYHHWGEPKRWYGVPAAAAGAFEAAFREELPEQFERQPDLLFHLVAMLSPAALRRRRVPVYGVLQVRRLSRHPGALMAPFALAPCSELQRYRVRCSHPALKLHAAEMLGVKQGT